MHDVVHIHVQVGWFGFGGAISRGSMLRSNASSLFSAGAELPRASQAVFAELQAVERLLRAERAAHGETRQSLSICNYQLSETRRSVAAMVVMPEAPAAAAPSIRLNVKVSSLSGGLASERDKGSRQAHSSVAQVTASVLARELAQMEVHVVNISQQGVAKEAMVQHALKREAELDGALGTARAKLTGEPTTLFRVDL
jgi:hypothetical protein